MAVSLKRQEASVSIGCAVARILATHRMGEGLFFRHLAGVLI